MKPEVVISMSIGLTIAGCGATSNDPSGIGGRTQIDKFDVN